MFSPAPPPFAAGQPSQPSVCQEAEQPRPFPSEQPQAAAALSWSPPPPATVQSAALPQHWPNLAGALCDQHVPQDVSPEPPVSLEAQDRLGALILNTTERLE